MRARSIWAKMPPPSTAWCGSFGRCTRIGRRGHAQGRPAGNAGRPPDPGAGADLPPVRPAAGDHRRPEAAGPLAGRTHGLRLCHASDLHQSQPADTLPAVEAGPGREDGRGGGHRLQPRVDADRYQATPDLRQRAAAVRADYGIPAAAPVVGFVGRLTRDKGVGELLEAFELVRARVPGARLLLRGDFEPGDPVPPETVRKLRWHPQISVAPFGQQMEACYQAMDVLAFPSFREGFANVPMEAAAAGLPVAGFAATGTVDAVVNRVTGTLVPPGDAAALGESIVRYLQDPELRRRARRGGPPARAARLPSRNGLGGALPAISRLVA